VVNASLRTTVARYYEACGLFSNSAKKAVEIQFLVIFYMLSTTKKLK